MTAFSAQSQICASALDRARRTGRLGRRLALAAVLAGAALAPAHARELQPGEAAARAFAAALTEGDVAGLGRLLHDDVAVSGLDGRGRHLRFRGEAQAINYLDAWRLSGGSSAAVPEVRLDGTRGARALARVSFVALSPGDSLRLEIEDGRVVEVEVGPGSPERHAALGDH